MTQVTVWETSEYQRLLDTCLTAADPHEKGAALEEFIGYVFGTLAGLTLQGRDLRMGSQELDLVFFNDQRCDYFRTAGPIVLIECKNWDAPVGSAETAWFLEKMRQRAVADGFLICRSGVTGECRSGRDGALDTLFGSLRDGLRPIVITLEEMASLASPEEFVALLKLKVARLMVRQL